MPTLLKTVRPRIACEHPERDRRELLIEVSLIVGQGMTLADAAAAIGVHVDSETALPPVAPNRCLFLPTPQQIAAACKEIQATWSDEERRSREVSKSPMLMAPRIRLREVGAA